LIDGQLRFPQRRLEPEGIVKDVMLIAQLAASNDDFMLRILFELHNENVSYWFLNHVESALLTCKAKDKT
jgi:hypothetical protein